MKFTLLSYFYTQISLILILVFLLKKSFSQNKAKFISAGIFIILSQFSIFFYFNSFTGVGFDESVYYHLLHGFIGITRRMIVVNSLLSAFFIATMASFCLFIYKQSVGSKIKKMSKAIIILIGISVFINPLTYNLFSYFSLGKTYESNFSVLEDKFFKLSEMKLKEGLEAKNLIYVYVESFERVFLDQSIFPGLAPNLARLAAENTEVTNIANSWGTSWTIAGMVANQCGIPLASFGHRENYIGKVGAYLPGVNCIGDLLKNAGYYLSYIGGDNQGFSGKGNFFNTHQFDEVYGEDSFEKEYKLSSDDFHHWGIYDELLYSHVIKNIKKLESKKVPYVQMLSTIETHKPYNASSKICQSLNYGDYKGDSVLEKFHCADFLLNRFITEIKSTVNLDNTLVIIASDHLMMGSFLNSYADADSRKNTFIVLDGKKIKNDKPAKMYDIAPSILDLMGFDVNRMGFGYSVIRPDFDPEINDAYMTSIEKLMIRFWDKEKF